MADLNQNPWVAAGSAVDSTFMSSAFDLLKLFLMGYGAYTLIKKAGNAVSKFFQPKEVVVEQVGGGPAEIEVDDEAPGKPQVIRVNPSRRRRRIIRRRRAV